ncbi:urocanate hydratase-like, partial [Limulus polyphemus]|uniref:Urocanate hydratase-like n=1 Tax=Limulus polyphemus TaxID=6850 RepID=A0ABM1C2Y5_LIMPO
VSREALEKRYKQGWVVEVEDDIDKLTRRIRLARQNKEIVSIGYHGNVVDVWERMVQEFETNGERLVDLGSDQTSCHNPFNGGYYPVQLTFHEAQQLMNDDPFRFKTLVQESLRRHVEAVNKMSGAGMFFFDYGNAFLLEADRAGK